jgi:proteinaceous RNase P
VLAPLQLCQHTGVTLQLADLSEDDWTAFEQQVQQLAEQQERQHGKFQAFVEWLSRSGPHDIMIDGANVALWGENYEGGGFRPEKIRVMHDAVAARHPGARILLVCQHIPCSAAAAAHGVTPS